MCYMCSCRGVLASREVQSCVPASDLLHLSLLAHTFAWLLDHSLCCGMCVCMAVTRMPMGKPARNSSVLGEPSKGVLSRPRLCPFARTAPYGFTFTTKCVALLDGPHRVQVGAKELTRRFTAGSRGQLRWVGSFSSGWRTPRRSSITAACSCSWCYGSCVLGPPRPRFWNGPRHSFICNRCPAMPRSALSKPHLASCVLTATRLALLATWMLHDAVGDDSRVEVT